MGIKHLNRYLYENCTKKSIRKIHLSELNNKTIVIDVSIYLYKFSSEDSLMENMYLLISILKHYKITPIFIFDGKPPPEKRELLQRRRLEKKEAEEKYMKLKDIMQDVSNNNITHEMQAEMDKLRRLFVRVNDEEIKRVKGLMDAYGATYYDAPSEADQLCAYLVKNGKAWGCISDDMDMFLYGCKYVIRNISLLNHTALLYDTRSILEELDMSEQIFCEIMVLSGTDYNIHSRTSLKETMRWYYEYLRYKERHKESAPKYSFYIWLIKHTKYVTDYKTLLRTYQIFHYHYMTDMERWNNIVIDDKKADINAIKKIMEKEGFVFI